MGGRRKRTTTDGCRHLGSDLGVVRDRCGGSTVPLNGFIGDEDWRVEVPEHFYDDELLINNGVSALRQLNRMTTPRLRDALYLRLR